MRKFAPEAITPIACEIGSSFARFLDGKCDVYEVEAGRTKIKKKNEEIEMGK